MPIPSAAGSAPLSTGRRCGTSGPARGPAQPAEAAYGSSPPSFPGFSGISAECSQRRAKRTRVPAGAVR